MLNKNNPTKKRLGYNARHIKMYYLVLQKEYKCNYREHVQMLLIIVDFGNSRGVLYQVIQIVCKY